MTRPTPCHLLQTAFGWAILALLGAAAAAADAPRNQAAKASGADAKSSAPASSRIVKFFVTVRDKKGDAESNADVQIQSEGTDARNVDATGAKLSLSATNPSTLTLIVPGFHCNVVFDPAKIKDDVVTLIAQRRDAGAGCSVQAGAAKAAK